MASIDVYVAAFVARCNVMRGPGRPEVDERGVRGLLSFPGDPGIRLLVTDDQAYELLAVLLSDAQAGTINVLAAAPRCAALLGGDPAWRSKTVTAMICRDLRTVLEVALPTELTLRRVRRLADDADDGVPLEDAVAAALRADPAIDEPPKAFANYLRSLPAAIGLFAAVDNNGVVQATSGSGAFGSEANVFFVNTEPGWRRRGIGQAMTVAALRAAQNAGATRACLDASDAGRSIYLRLGFQAVGRSTQFFRAG
jgi:ribosomal protein S18 acetylase RimI-like enzyme